MKKLIALLSSVSLVATAGVAGIATVACGSSSNETTVPLSEDMEAAFVQLYYATFGSNVYQITTQNWNQKAITTISSDINAKLVGKEVNDKIVESIVLVYIAVGNINLTDKATLGSIIENNPTREHDVQLTLKVTFEGDTTNPITINNQLIYRTSFAESLVTITSAYINDFKTLLAKTDEKLLEATVNAYDTKPLTEWIKDVLQQGTINPNPDITGFVTNQYVGYGSSLKDYDIPTALTIINNDSSLADDITFGAYLYDTYNAQTGFPVPEFTASLTVSPTTVLQAEETVTLPLSITDGTLYFIPDTDVNIGFELVDAEYESVLENKSMFLFDGGILPVTDVDYATAFIESSIQAYLNYYKKLNSLTANQLSVSTVSIKNSADVLVTSGTAIDYSATDTYTVTVSFSVASASVSAIPNLVYTGIKTVSEVNFNTEIYAFRDFMETNHSNFATVINYQGASGASSTVGNFDSAYGGSGNPSSKPISDAFVERATTFIMRKAQPWHKWNFVNLLNYSGFGTNSVTVFTGGDAAAIRGAYGFGIWLSSLEDRILTVPSEFTAYDSATAAEWTTTDPSIRRFTVLAAPDVTDATTPVDFSPVNYSTVMTNLKALLSSAAGTFGTGIYPFYAYTDQSVGNINQLDLTTANSSTPYVSLEQIRTAIIGKFTLSAPSSGTSNAWGYNEFAKTLFQPDNLVYYTVDYNTYGVTTVDDPTATFTNTAYDSFKPIALGMRWVDPDGGVHYIGPTETTTSGKVQAIVAGLKVTLGA